MLPAEGEQKQLEIYKNRPNEERLQSALNLNQLTLKIMQAGIYEQFPAISQEEYQKQIHKRLSS